MAVGLWTVFDRAILKLLNGTVDLSADTVNCVLLGSAQALTPSFVGSSTDCRYADLTAELSTANGYTAGGVALASTTLFRRTAAVVAYDADDPAWTITGAGLAAVKYAVLYSVTAANDDLIAYLDLDTAGGTVAAPSGPLSIPLSADGILGFFR